MTNNPSPHMLSCGGVRENVREKRCQGGEQRVKDMDFCVGELARGRRNQITDVEGVRVGHATIDEGDVHTGVTVIMPSMDNPFFRKLPCACHVLNGFGKSAGLVQIEELGQLETPIALTNTLNVGLVWDAMCSYMLKRCRDEGREVRSINPVVMECNDSYLSDISRRAVREEHVLSAIREASEDFLEGAIGCGRGMSCHGLKGGVGSASRVVKMQGETFTFGAFVLTNHGRLHDLTIQGKPVGREIEQAERASSGPDVGSCIMILATDAPLSSRQLQRVIRRMQVGTIRLGSFIGHGSGEIMLGFSTCNRYDPETDGDVIAGRFLNESRMDLCFRAAAECTEEAVLHSLFQAQTLEGRDSHVRHALSEYLDLKREI